MRLLTAFLFAPAAVVLALALLLTFSAARASPMAFALFALPIAYVSAGVFGAPLYCLFRKSGWLAWWHALLGGIACALPCATVLAIGNSGALVGPLLCLAIGGSVALLFWVIAIRRGIPQRPAVTEALPTLSPGGVSAGVLRASSTRRRARL